MNVSVCCVLLLLGLARLAAAASPCPDGGSLPASGDLSAHALELAALAPRCGHDAGFLAWQGAVLLRLGRPREAAEALELALLRAPEHQGARLDYARALAALGEVEAAGELLAGVAARPDVPAAARDYLAGLLAAVPRDGWRGNGAAILRVGRDSNLNRATGARDLTLTLPDGDLTLPLAPESRVRGGAFLQGRLDIALRRGLPAGRELEFLGRLAARGSPGVEGVDLGQADLLAQWRLPRGDHAWYWGLGYAQTDWNGETLQRQWRLTWRRDWAAGGGCRPWLGIDLEDRVHPRVRDLDHLLGLAHAAWTCDHARPWALQLAHGREFASARPSAVRWTARYVAWWPLAGDARWEVEARLDARREARGYSPLLGGDAPLATRALLARLEYRRPLGGRWEAGAGVEIERQAASLPLFALTRRAAHVELLWRW